MTYAQSQLADRITLPHGRGEAVGLKRGRGVSKPVLRVVLRRLADRADAHGIAWPCARTLAGYSFIEGGGWDDEGADLDERTVRDALKVLTHAGLIERVRRGRKGVTYRLCEQLVNGSDTRSKSGRATRSKSGETTRSPSSESGSTTRRERVNGQVRTGEPPDKTTKNPPEESTTTSSSAAHDGLRAPADHDGQRRGGGGGGVPIPAGGAGLTDDLDEAERILTHAGVRKGKRELARKAGSVEGVLYAHELAKGEPNTKSVGAITREHILEGNTKPPRRWQPKREALEDQLLESMLEPGLKHKQLTVFVEWFGQDAIDEVVQRIAGDQDDALVFPDGETARAPFRTVCAAARPADHEHPLLHDRLLRVVAACLAAANQDMVPDAIAHTTPKGNEHADAPESNSHDEDASEAVLVDASGNEHIQHGDITDGPDT